MEGLEEEDMRHKVMARERKKGLVKETRHANVQSPFYRLVRVSYKSPGDVA